MAVPGEVRGYAVPNYPNAVHDSVDVNVGAGLLRCDNFGVHSWFILQLTTSVQVKCSWEDPSRVQEGNRLVTNAIPNINCVLNVNAENPVTCR
jgi:hypothetical protein